MLDIQTGKKASGGVILVVYEPGSFYYTTLSLVYDLYQIKTFWLF